MRLRALRNVLRESHRSLAGLMLAGAMLTPVAEVALGWPVHTPLGVPLLAHLAILAVVGTAALGTVTNVRATFLAEHRIALVLAAPLAVVLADIVHVRANVFYTERALIEGMAVSCVLQAGIVVLRRHAQRRLGPKPGMRLADALSHTVGWLLLVSWMLIALEHRHPAGPLLLLAGVAQVLALLALVPDAMAGAGWLGPGSPPIRRRS